ncbi:MULTISPECIES: GtrA family protein [unclassified Corynebacterium]|uniref:GtrA family protein n=1 Tax=unclassified Corynebacterium TaxID=2624378 RepID=UPI001EF23831|nr:GtrA family protein [Corynebacterium sp. ACRPH]MCG7456620.1 GtrA family protein [Corynebacterium sp. ACRPH]
MSKPSFNDAINDAPSPQPGTDPAGTGHSSGAGTASGAATGASNVSGPHAVSGAAADNATAGQGARGGDNFQSEHTTRAQRIIQSQLVKFVLVGGFSAVVDFGSTTLFTFAFGLSDGVAKALGFVLGTLTAYFINRRWTFQAEPSGRRFAITMVTYGLTFIVQWGLYKVSIPWLEGFDLNAFWVRAISFVIAQGTATVLNFLIQKFLIFKR